ncbi:hypothetical protein LSCM1_03916 [Leishmania martiniquensis]|uniref:Uncharacterized protein n=1 Tax=Leishmania martiniquensis TaxID=1580590 RepID=A0A836GV94_9TRYP|nr:hypothetical protein LSCM1_03916 [Leishmania martiniquensis]
MMSSCLSRIPAALCVTAVLALLCGETSLAQANCGSTPLCRPYEKIGPACLRNRRMNLRFILDTAKENNFTVGSTLHNVATYGFCPVVDQLSSFTLTGAPFLASSYITKDEASGSVTRHLSLGMKPRYLSVYGFGTSNSTAYPEKGFSRGTVLVAVNGSHFTGVSNSVGIVTILSLEIGLHSGLFNYIGATEASETTVSNPNFDPRLCNSTISSSGVTYCDMEITVPVAATVVQPAKVGFTPTCDAHDTCTMADPHVYQCIGDIPGQKNCGVYKSDPNNIEGLQLTVWVSYYGTDSRRKVLTSGGKNPLNFVSFARTNALRAIGDKISNLFHGNISVLL